ncbi:hypothetical protein L226DRAFT_617072 [Lentinus tigrinus ALCF2SS1-7]|uniref:TERF2-interacting telomeric protein 1 Myb domain-containing protein n=1 Tax=Lentinus tigrinus ALCF2SS1-6 TaxID=1328759 RepID=A0A5C2RXA7_9APHY|nr:hypothetical protein L227DRAFT_656721 [Lentinus tigrinus ALCF2SS1-6]RPD69091.1 hypothetical protein L226DRAFT_617072 [Lentinus tigrinus ALCF2SS1-7]
MAISRDNSPQNQDIFVVDGKPVSFYLWGTNHGDGLGWSLSGPQRDTLKDKINQHGGRVLSNQEGADTIIVQQMGLDELRDRYSLVRCYVEPPVFVAACIRNKKYEHQAPKHEPMSMGGRTPGTFRAKFTQSDDQHLCEFLSVTIPYPEAGGRQGNKLWKKLVDDAVNVPELKWARRHPWMSWRERYKKNQERFDPIIDALVKKNPPPPDGKGLFPYDRRVNGMHYDAFMQAQQHLAAEEEEEEEEEGGEFQRTPDDDDEEEDHDDVYSGHVDASFEQEVPRRNIRRDTDPGPRWRNASPDEPHGRTRTRTGPQQRQRTPPGEFEPSMNDDHDFDYQPEAGPSGTQRSPSLSPAVPSPSQSARKTVAPRPFPRHSAAAVMQTHPTQVPMSSQATLVGPVPTQLRGASAQAQAGPVPRTVAHRQTGRRAASRMNAIPANEEEEAEEGDGDEESQEAGEEEPQSYIAGQTNEDEENVEEILDGSYERSASEPEAEDEVIEVDEVEVVEEAEEEIASSMEVQLDSDDERTRQRLLGAPPRSTAQAGSSRSQGKRAAPHTDDEDDDIEFAESLDIDKPVPRRSSTVPSARRSLAPATPRPAPLRRRGTDGYTSSESAVPLPYTRASVEKKRRRVEEQYVPPAGTRAAEASTRKSPPHAPSPQIRQLRNRKVAL